MINVTLKAMGKGRILDKWQWETLLKNIKAKSSHHNLSQIKPKWMAYFIEVKSNHKNTKKKKSMDEYYQLCKLGK